MKLKLKYTQSSQLSNLPIVDGQLIILTDKPGMYYDLNSTRNPVKVDVEDSLSSSSTTAALSAKQGKALNDSLSKTYKLQGKVTHNKLPATPATNDMYIMNDTFVAGSNFAQQGKTIAKGTPVVFRGALWDALYIGETVGYSNTTSGLSATNVQDAIDETAGVELTQAEYDALPAAQKSSGTYYITDAPSANISIDTALSSTSTNPVQNKVVAGAINQINSDLTPIDGTLTFDGNSGGSTFQLRKVGKQVSLCFRYRTGKNTNFTSDKVATLPEGFRPSMFIYMPVVKFNSAGLVPTGHGYVKCLPNGDVNYYGDAFAFQEFIFVNGSFVIS